MKQKRNALPVARGIVGRRVTVIREVPVAAWLCRIGVAAPTICTIRRVDPSTGRYWLDKLVVTFEIVRLRHVPEAALTNMPEALRALIMDQQVSPPIMVRRRRVFSRAELRFVRRSYTCPEERR